MEKQTVNVITREFIKKELRFYNTADVRSTLVLCGAISLLLVPLTIGVVCGILELFKPEWLKILLSVLVGGLVGAPIWLILLSLRTRLRERKLLQNGDFDIVVCAQRALILRAEVQAPRDGVLIPVPFSAVPDVLCHVLQISDDLAVLLCILLIVPECRPDILKKRDRLA